MTRRRAVRATLAALLGLAVLSGRSVQGPDAVAAPAPGGTAMQGGGSGVAPPPPLAFAGALSRDSDLLLLPAARRPAPRPLVTAATRVAARPQAVSDVFLDPGALRQALPALVGAEVLSTRPGPRPDGWPDRLIAWEVEVPLFNLTGKAWLQQRPDGAELTLVEGAFAPGRVRLRTAPSAEGTVLTCEFQVEVRTANWIFRKVARHDPWAETAMSAAMAWVVTRAVALRAEAAPGQAPARPRAPIAPPAATALDGALLGKPALAPLRAGSVVASVHRAANGRLAWSSVAVRVPGAPGPVASRLALPESWTVFPGWKSVKRLPARPAGGTSAPATGTTGAPAAVLIGVEDDIALVNLNAVWAVDLRPPGRATAVEGDIHGAVFRWQTFPSDSAAHPSPDSAAGSAAAAGDRTLAVLSMHPRLNAAGYIERKLVAAEPLLEHALAVALSYVNAASMADDFDRRPGSPLPARGWPSAVPAPAPVPAN